MSQRAANLLLLFAGAVWGMGFIAQETAMDDVGPFLFTALRFLLAGVLVLPLAIRERARINQAMGLKEIRSLLVLGAMFFLALLLQQIGLVTTSVTNAGFLTALYVLFVPLFLFFGLRQPQAFIIWPASLLALLGIFMLSGGAFSSLNTGDWLVILGAGFTSIHMILVAKIGRSSGAPFTLASAQFLIAGLLGVLGYFLAPLISMSEAALSFAMLEEIWVEVVYAGAFSGALAFTLMAIGQRYTPPASAAIFLSSESLFAALFGALLLGERLTLIGYAGCGLLFLAIILAELKPSFRFTKSLTQK